MKLLIKIFLDELNPYDLDQIIELLNSNTNEDTEICIMTNESEVNYEPYRYYYLSDVNIPKMINYKLDEIDWDIILPIFKPCITIKGVDSVIRKLYTDKFKNLDGILSLNDEFFVIGKNFYKKLGYLYNPAYNKKNFENELVEISKLSNKYSLFKQPIMKVLSLKSDDDKIFELRKKFNFSL